MILLADDNDILRAALTRHLAELGYVSHSVTNGKEAVERALSGAYKLVILDLNLPLIDGTQAAQMIRDSLHRDQKSLVPIVGLASERALVNSADARSTCMDQVLQKPVSLDDLRALTERWAPQNESNIVAQITPALVSLIADARNKLGYSIEELAAKAELPAEHVRSIEAGHRIITIVDLVKLSLALNVATSDLVSSAQIKAKSD